MHSCPLEHALGVGLGPRPRPRGVHSVTVTVTVTETVTDRYVVRWDVALVRWVRLKLSLPPVSVRIVDNVQHVSFAERQVVVCTSVVVV